MKPIINTEKDGWHQPQNAFKKHYFPAGRIIAICSSNLAATSNIRIDVTPGTKSVCADCQRLLRNKESDNAPYLSISKAVKKTGGFNLD